MFHVEQAGGGLGKSAPSDSPLAPTFPGPTPAGMSSPALTIDPITRPGRTVVTPPGSKSITNRALVFAALAEGPVTLTGALFSRDTRIMCAALKALGFEVATDEKAKTIALTGLGGRIPNAKATIHIGNAGTAARFLTAMLALHPEGEFTLDGDEAMRARPMGGLLEALVAQGGSFTDPATGLPTDRFPFVFRTRGLRGGDIPVDASASSQMLSALLIAAPYATSPATVKLIGHTVSEPFVDMTVRMCAQFGVLATSDGVGSHAFPAGRSYKNPAVYAVEPDATAASYFLALPLAAPVDTTVGGLSENGLQGDTAFAGVLKRMGLTLTETDRGWTVSVPTTTPSGRDEDFNAFSDTFLTLAATATLLDGPTTIRGIAHTRKQETDRVLAMCTELERLGQQCSPNSAELRADKSLSSLTVFPDKAALKRAAANGPVPIHTYEDHRVAMSFGILGTHDLFGDGRPWITIEDPACCGKTFPDFFEVLARIRAGL